MRTLLILGTVAVLSFVATGCGGNKAKAEQLAQQMIDEMNKVADAAEKGDKAGMKAALSKIASLTKEAESVKVTKSQDKAVEDKFKPQLEAASKRMAEAMTKAMLGGKFTPADLAEIQGDLQNLGQGIKKAE